MGNEDVVKHFSLLQVMKSIQTTLANRYSTTFWVKAEINKLNYYSYSGHCYPELVEKKDGKVIAQLKAVLWKNDFDRVNAKFIQLLKEPLKDGVLVLFLASVQFDSLYGLSLKIHDIDPSFSLGELEREKQEAIDRLKAESIFECNKRLPFPLLPKRIALISVETSKGLADFIKVIDQNPWKYSFFYHLFPALLQGDKSIPSIIAQLERIKKVQHHFDVVAIIRGGGGDVGLSSYNNFELSKAIALFPIPVITGIGHSTNETVAELVSYKYAITPTELADFLIQKFHDFAVPVQRASERIPEFAKRLLIEEQKALGVQSKLLTAGFFSRISSSQFSLENIQQRIGYLSTALLNQNQLKLSMSGLKIKSSLQLTERNRMRLNDFVKNIKRATENQLAVNGMKVDSEEKKVELMSPQHVLERGYTITLHKGKAITDFSALKIGDVLSTITHQGRLESEIKTMEE
jgi:exodeoxyribonuclease VII large subunit